METTVEYAVAETVAAAFDYGLIDEGIRDEVKAAARTIHQLSAGVMTGIVAIGKRLIEVKGMIPHGQFVDWIVGEFQIEPRMAQNYMNVAREYGDPQKRNIISLFSPTVAYLLAAPSMPEEARVEVEQAALSGQKVTVEMAKKAAATFAEPKPAKPQPIQYAKIHTLETCVRQWLSIAIGEGGTPDPDSVIDMLKLQSGEPHKSGNWLSLLCQSLTEADIAWRKADLVQAINNVRDQRRQAKLQASGRAVYVESKPEPTPEPIVEDAPDVEPTPEQQQWQQEYGASMAADELEAVALVAAEQAEEDAERAARDAARPSFEKVPEPEPVERPGILTREWVIFVLVNYTPASSDFAIALSAATLDDLREAMSSFDQEEKHWRARLDAIKNRMTELMAPDPRIAEAQSLIALLTAAREGVRRDYGRLCGKHLDALTFERDVETMCGRLQSLVDILTGKDVTK